MSPNADPKLAWAICSALRPYWTLNSLSCRCFVFSIVRALALSVCFAAPSSARSNSMTSAISRSIFCRRTGSVGRRSRSNRMPRTIAQAAFPAYIKRQFSELLSLMRGSARAPRREQSPAANPVPRSASPTARPRAALLPRPGFWAIRTFCARGVLHKDKVLIRPRPRPSIYRLFYRGTGKRRQRKDRAGGYCAPARTVHQSPCACRTAPATDRSSPTAAASGSTFKLPDNLERQSQRFFVDQPVDRHGKAAAAPDFDPAGVGWRGQRFGGRQFDKIGRAHV